MTDLAAWITAQVECIEKGDSPHSPSCDSVPVSRSCCGTEDCDCGDYDGTGSCDCGGPEQVARRCAADRKTLARHEPHLSGSTDCVVRCERAHFGVQVCNHDGHRWPCGDITDLAISHGWESP